MIADDRDCGMWDFLTADEEDENEIAFPNKGLKDITKEVMSELTQEAASVTVIRLNNNKLKELPPNLFNAGQIKLKIIDLHSNKIISSTLIYFPPTLEVLNLSDNELTEIPSSALKLPNLESLNVSQNQISVIPPEEAWDIPKLTKFQMSKNAVTTIPLFVGKFSLDTLTLEENPISNVPPFVLREGTTSILDFLRTKREEAANLDKKMASEVAMLESLLKDGDGYHAVHAFLSSEHSEENLLFWKEVEDLLQIDENNVELIEDTAEAIFQKYIATEATTEVNIPAKIKEKLRKIFYFSGDELMSNGYELRMVGQNVFSEAQSSIVVLLKIDCWRRFEKSKYYAEYKTKKEKEQEEIEQLHNLVQKGNKKDVDSLLKKKGVGILKLKNKISQTALHIACAENHLKVVDLLISRAKEAKDLRLNDKDSNGFAPILLAASNYHLQVIVMLISAGANVKITSPDKSGVLHFLSRSTVSSKPSGSWLKSIGEKKEVEIEKVFKMLIEKGGQNLLNMQNIMGDGPLHEAVSSYNLSLLSLLIDSKANLQLRNKKNQTALTIAVNLNRPDLVNILKQALNPQTTINNNNNSPKTTKSAKK